MSSLKNPTLTRNSLARRERLNPGWPISITNLRCWPMHHEEIDDGPTYRPARWAEIPQHVKDTAHLMNALWNEMCVVFQRASALDMKDDAGKALLPKEARAAIWFPFGQRKTVETEKNGERYNAARDAWGGTVPTLHKIGCAYNGRLPSACYEAVVARFIVTVREWQKNPKRSGPPRFKQKMESINIPVVFNAGLSATNLPNCSQASVRQTFDLPETDAAYLINGHFTVGVEKVVVPLHVAHDKPNRALRDAGQASRIPDDARIKRISLVGTLHQSLGWQWSFQVQHEHPRPTALPPVGRVAGLDLGWRALEDGIRLGVLADSEERVIEIRLPYSFGSHRRDRQKGENVTDWRDFEEKQAQIDAAKDACKEALRGMPKTDWPEEARTIWQGRVKIGVGGLFRLMHALPPESEARAVLMAWSETYTVENRRLRGRMRTAEQVRDAAYRRLCHWLAQNYDQVAWEGDLSLKEMAEDGGKRKDSRKAEHEEDGKWRERTPAERILEASQRYRQIASLYRLRLNTREAFAKYRWGATDDPAKFNSGLIDRKAAYSTRECEICGAVSEPSHKLLILCPNGHERDQDVRASTNLLNTLETPASTSKKPLAVPDELRRYLRLLAGSW